MTYAVLLAGGIGSRVGANIPKQFIKIKLLFLLQKSIYLRLKNLLTNFCQMKIE